MQKTFCSILQKDAPIRRGPFICAADGRRCVDRHDCAAADVQLDVPRWRKSPARIQRVVACGWRRSRCRAGSGSGSCARGKRLLDGKRVQRAQIELVYLRAHVRWAEVS